MKIKCKTSHRCPHCLKLIHKMRMREYQKHREFVKKAVEHHGIPWSWVQSLLNLRVEVGRSYRRYQRYDLRKDVY